MKKQIKKQIQNRLSRIIGQAKGLQGMIEREEYCIDIITQSTAIRSALSAVEDLMLENHLSTHVIEQMKGGHEKKAVFEVIEVFKKIKKK